jgi:hypothetical protein
VKALASVRRISTRIILRQSFNELNSCAAAGAVNRAADAKIVRINRGIELRRIIRVMAPAQNNDRAATFVASSQFGDHLGHFLQWLMRGPRGNVMSAKRAQGSEAITIMRRGENRTKTSFATLHYFTWAADTFNRANRQSRSQRWDKLACVPLKS